MAKVKFKKVRRLKPDDTWLCKCGHKEKLGGYVAAHWTIELNYTCPECGRKYTITNGLLELQDDE